MGAKKSKPAGKPSTLSEAECKKWCKFVLFASHLL